MRTKHAGFTLVEIAIVLVIIGLLLGGILKGQEMIVQAKIKNAIADLSGTSAAYYGYRDRYRATPGDDPSADTRWGVTKGDGNGIVAGKFHETCSGTPAAGLESCHWWNHLRRAGFISGSGSEQPLNAFTGKIGVQTGNAADPPGAALGALTGLIICSANLSDKVAIALDAQMDDGKIATGTVRAQPYGTATTDISDTAAASDYQETGTNTYTSCRAL